MKHDSRLSSTLHALLHMARSDGPITSEILGKCLNTNPVVVRRTMGLLRRAGIVTSEKGHSGGWTIAKALTELTLRDIHSALGEPAVLGLGHRTAAPACLVEQSVNAALGTTFRQAEDLLLEQFGAITLAALAQDVSKRQTARQSGIDGP